MAAKEIKGVGQKYTEQAFLGKNVVDEGYKRAVVGIANRFRTDILDPTNGNALTSENTRKLIENVSFNRFHDMASLQRAAEQGDNAAIQCQSYLTDGLLLIMRDGGDARLSGALNTGITTNIEGALPTDLVLLAREVRNKAFTNPDIRSVLDQIDNEAFFEPAIAELVNMRSRITPGSEDRKQLVLALEYCQTMVKKNKGVVVPAPGGGGVSSELEKQLKSLVDALTSGESKSESTYDTFVNAEFIQQPIQLQLDTFPPSWFKRPPDWFNGGVGEWQQVVRARVNLTNASYIKQEVASLDGEAAKKNNWLKLTERELALIYEIPGVRESMETIVNDFFEVNGKGFLKLKKSDIDWRGFLVPKDNDPNKVGWDKALASFRDYEKGLVDYVMTTMNISELDAKASVAMSWNFLYVSNVMESADNDRDIGGGCANVFGEQIRAMMHPLAKAKQKFGVKPDADKEKSQGIEEGWGEYVGAWFADLMTWDDTRNDFLAALKSGTLKPFPERIGMSMLETIKVQVGTKLNAKKETVPTFESMAQLLVDKKKIVFGSADSNLFGNYGDNWDTYFKFYNYAVGKTPLELGKNVSKWGNDLADLLAKFRGIKSAKTGEVLFDDLDSAESFGWLILNSLGIVRSPKLMINLRSELDYGSVLGGILKLPRLVPEKKKREEIEKMLHGGFFRFAERSLIQNEAAKRVSKSK
ncbi:MAG: hypothetical protein NTY75_03600 [Candidatus Shapirobacteria bacterium]|nr:hypothetical protein [Candidatus Shapirobacteria bacterium]